MNLYGHVLKSPRPRPGVVLQARGVIRRDSLRRRMGAPIGNGPPCEPPDAREPNARRAGPALLNSGEKWLIGSEFRARSITIELRCARALGVGTVGLDGAPYRSSASCQTSLRRGGALAAALDRPRSILL